MHPACVREVLEGLRNLGFQTNANRIGKDRNSCCTLDHRNGIECEIPYCVLEEHPEIEQKINAVLAYYIEFCCTHQNN